MKYSFGLLGSTPLESPSTSTLSTRREKLARELWNAPSKEEMRRLFIQDRRNRFRGLIDGHSDEVVYHKFREVFSRAQREIERLLGPQFLPPELRQKPVRPIRLPHDPVELMKLVFPRLRLEKPQSPVSLIEFEAQRKLEIGYALFLIDLEKFRDLKKDNFKWIAEYLKELGIIQELPKKITITNYHDRNNELRFCGSTFTEVQSACVEQTHIATLEHRPYACIIPTDAHTDLGIHALYSMRHKRPMSIIRKASALGERLPEHIPDTIAMRFTFKDTNELRRGKQIISEQLPEGCVFEEQDRLENTDRQNPHSASEYHDFSYHARLVDPYGYSHICEIQLVTLEVTSNVEYSAAPSNHRRYEVRQLLGSQPHEPQGLFFRILPPSLYGINWGDVHIKQQIDAYIVENIMRHYS